MEMKGIIDFVKRWFSWLIVLVLVSGLVVNFTVFKANKVAKKTVEESVQIQKTAKTIVSSPDWLPALVVLFLGAIILTFELRKYKKWWTAVLQSIAWIGFALAADRAFTYFPHHLVFWLILASVVIWISFRFTRGVYRPNLRFNRLPFARWRLSKFKTLIAFVLSCVWIWSWGHFKNPRLFDFSNLIGLGEWIERVVNLLLHLGIGFLLGYLVIISLVGRRKLTFNWKVLLAISAGIFLVFRFFGPSSPGIGYPWRTESFREVKVGATHQDTLAFVENGGKKLLCKKRLKPMYREVYTGIELKKGMILAVTVDQTVERYINFFPSIDRPANRPNDAKEVWRGLTSWNGDPRNLLPPQYWASKLDWLDKSAPMGYPVASAGRGKYTKIMVFGKEWVFLEVARDGELILNLNIPRDLDCFRQSKPGKVSPGSFTMVVYELTNYSYSGQSEKIVPKTGSIKT
jgi:hypothetical protein